MAEDEIPTNIQQDNNVVLPIQIIRKPGSNYINIKLPSKSFQFKNLNSSVIERVIELAVGVYEENLINILRLSGFIEKNNKLILDTGPLNLDIEVTLSKDSIILSYKSDSFSGQKTFEKSIDGAYELINTVDELIKSTESLKQPININKYIGIQNIK